MPANERPGEICVAATRADAAVVGPVEELSLVDGAGVVVQAAGDGQVRHDAAGRQVRQFVQDEREFVQTLGEQVGGDAEATDVRGHSRVDATDVGEIQTGFDLCGCQRGPRGEQLLDPGRTHFVNLVRDPDDAERVVDAQAAVEALQHLPIVDIDRPGGDVQAGQDLVDDPGELGVEVQRNVVDVDDVDVALGELAVAALLRTLATPDPLHLVALEREDQVVEVCGDVPGERHGQVEVQAESGIAVVGSLGLEPAQCVDLL